MAFNKEFILEIKQKYTRVELSDGFILFLNKYVKKSEELKRNQQTYNKSNKTPKQFYKQHKQSKVQKIIIRNNNAWYPTTHSTAKNIINIIKANLNKLTTTNFESLSNIIIHEINNTDINIINLLCDEIINKNTYDKDFQDEYIKLCKKIWNIKLYKSFTEILLCTSNNKYYCKINTSTQSSDPSEYTYSYIGPYNSSKDITKYLEYQYSFKRILLNRLFDIFKERYNIYGSISSNLKDEDVYKKKRKVSSIIEFVCKLYLQNLVPFNIIYLINIDILTFQLENIEYKKYDIELLYTIWGLLKDVSIQKYNNDYINNIYNILHFIIEPLVDIIQMTPRIKFFIVNIQDIIKTKFKCIYNEQSIDSFNIIIDKQVYSKYGNNRNEDRNEDSNEDSDDSNDSDDSADSDDSDDSNDDSDEDSNDDSDDKGDDIEDIILKNLKNVDDLYKLIISNDINEYLEILVFINIQDISHLSNTIIVLSKILNEKMNKKEMDDIVSYNQTDLDEFALDNCNASKYYGLFLDAYNKIEC